MGKYSSMDRGSRPKKQQEIHPIWRAIGLAMILLIPFISWVGMLVLLDENSKNRWFTLPRDLIMRQWDDPMLLIKIVFTVTIAFILYIFFTMITFILWRIIAPPKLGPYDVPRVAFKGKSKVR